MAARKPKAVTNTESVTGVFCPGCGKPLKDPDARLVHEGCPEDRRFWVTVPPPRC
jgi:hypothetical protein